MDYSKSSICWITMYNESYLKILSKMVLKKCLNFISILLNFYNLKLVLNLDLYCSLSFFRTFYAAF